MSAYSYTTAGGTLEILPHETDLAAAEYLADRLADRGWWVDGNRRLRPPSDRMRDYTADVFGSENALIRGTVYMDREALPVVLRAIADAIEAGLAQ